MVAINNDVSLMLRAMELTFHHDKYSVGKIYSDASSRYNDYRGPNYPYEFNWHDISTNILTVHTDTDGFPHSFYLSNFIETDVDEGINFTDKNRFSGARVPYYSQNLKQADLNPTTAGSTGQGTFIIGPEGPYHNSIVNETKQPAYWSHVDPSGFFDFSYFDFESTGVVDFTSNGETQSVPRIYDIHRDSYHLPNGLSNLTGDTRYHQDANQTESISNHQAFSSQTTRTLAMSGSSNFIGSSFGTLGGNMEVNYNLGEMKHEDNNHDFCIYMKFQPTGYPATQSQSLKSGSINLFQNHTIKIALVPFEEPQQGTQRHGKYRIAIYGRTGDQPGLPKTIWNNINYVVGFDPTPNTRNVNKRDDWAGTPDPENLYYQWLGSDPLLFDNDHLRGTGYRFPYLFGINKQAYYANNSDQEGQYGIKALGRQELTTQFGAVNEFNNSLPGGGPINQWQQPIDRELEVWYNWGIEFPEPIHVNKTTSLVVSYASSGCDERNNLLMSTFGDPYASGMLLQYVPTLSVMYNTHDVDFGSAYQRSVIHAKYRDYFDQETDDSSGYYGINPNRVFSKISSYDIHCLFNVQNYSTGSDGTRFPILASNNPRPFQTYAEGSTGIYQDRNYATKASFVNMYNGYLPEDYYASGYLGSSQFAGHIEEFGYGKTTISAANRKKIIDSNNNLGGLIGYNTDDTFTESSDKISFKVTSGTTYGENSIGGIFNDDYSVSSSLEINIGEVLGISADPIDGIFLWQMDPFLEPNDLKVNVVLSHNDFGAEQVAPTVWCNIVDKTDWQQNINYGNLPANGGLFRDRIISSSLLNRKGRWIGDRKTLDPNVTRQKFTFSGVTEAFGCGNWDLRDKRIVFGIDYPSSGNAYDAQLDVYAMDLDIDWFKTEVELTGDDPTGGSNNIDLFIRGVQAAAVADNIDLFIQNDKADDGLDLYIGADNGMPSGIVELFMPGSASGVSTIYNNHTLNIRGLDFANSGTDLFIKFAYPAEGLPLFVGSNVPDSVVTVDQTTLVIDAIYNSDVNKAANLFIYGVGEFGDVDPQSVLPLYIEVPGTAAAVTTNINPENAMNLFLNGKVFNNSDNVTLSILNNVSGVNEGMNLVIRKAGTEGALPSNDNMPLYIERNPAHEGYSELYITGHDSPISSGTEMFITGKLPTSNDNTEMFLANYKSNKNLEIYMRGFK